MVSKHKIADSHAVKMRNKPGGALPQRLGKLTVWQLVLLLIIVVGGGTFFVGMSAGWLDEKEITLDAEMYCGESCGSYLLDIDARRYNELVEEEKTFMLLVDQGGCRTADRLRNFAESYAREVGVKIYRMMFEEMKETDLYGRVKYYPSVVIVSRGVPAVWLRADKDEDAEEYNDYDSFRKWVEGHLSVSF